MDPSFLQRMMAGAGAQEKTKQEEKFEDKRLKHKITSTVVDAAKNLGKSKWIPYAWFLTVIGMGVFAHMPQPEEDVEAGFFSSKVLPVLWAMMPFFQ